MILGLQEALVFSRHISRNARPQDYETFFILKSTEYENYPAHKC